MMYFPLKFSIEEFILTNLCQTKPIQLIKTKTKTKKKYTKICLYLYCICSKSKNVHCRVINEEYLNKKINIIIEKSFVTTREKNNK